jgi:hypothetical protein
LHLRRSCGSTSYFLRSVSAVKGSKAQITKHHKRSRNHVHFCSGPKMCCPMDMPNISYVIPELIQTLT